MDELPEFGDRRRLRPSGAVTVTDGPELVLLERAGHLPELAMAARTPCRGVSRASRSNGVRSAPRESLSAARAADGDGLRARAVSSKCASTERARSGHDFGGEHAGATEARRGAEFVAKVTATGLGCCARPRTSQARAPLAAPRPTAFLLVPEVEQRAHAYGARCARSGVRPFAAGEHRARPRGRASRRFLCREQETSERGRWLLAIAVPIVGRSARLAQSATARRPCAMTRTRRGATTAEGSGAQGGDRRRAPGGCCRRRAARVRCACAAARPRKHQCKSRVE